MNGEWRAATGWQAGMVASGWIWLDLPGFIGVFGIYDLRYSIYELLFGRGGWERIAGLEEAVSDSKVFLVGLGWIRLDFCDLRAAFEGGAADCDGASFHSTPHVVPYMRCMISSFGAKNVMPEWTGAVQAALLSARRWCLSNGNVGND